jgi:hypothetical protein
MLSAIGAIWALFEANRLPGDAVSPSTTAPYQRSSLGFHPSTIAKIAVTTNDASSSPNRAEAMYNPSLNP